jgi:endonuclease/exonuclease/phosphatase family metal-dependent hydrolase
MFLTEITRQAILKETKPKEPETMKNALFALVILNTCNSVQAMDVPAANPIRIMTFNIRRAGNEKDAKNLWQNRKTRVIDLIKSLHPDVMGLQEPTIEQVHDLGPALNMAWIGSGRGSSWFGMGPDEYNPIFFNTHRLRLLEYGTFQINPCSTMQYLWDREKYGLLPRICTWGKFQDVASQHEFFVFNTHLDHLYSRAQVHGLETILKFIEAKPSNIPLFLMGDLNTEITPDLQNTVLKNFINTNSLAREKTGPEETRTGWQHEELKKIDHILVRHGTSITVRRHTTIVEQDKDMLPSDHRPVIIDVEFRK